MDCTYALVLNNQFYPELQVNQAIKGGDLVWKQKFPWSGKVVLADEYSSTWIEDEMTPLFVNLAGSALVEALESGKGNYPYFEMYGNVSVEIEDGLLTISGDFVPGKATFFAFEAIQSILVCGVRYVQLLEAIPFPEIFPKEDIEQLKECLELLHSKLLQSGLQAN
ncbi:MAG: hypothetical protein U0176_11150 [Bacteroidia bacterium]